MIPWMALAAALAGVVPMGDAGPVTPVPPGPLPGPTSPWHAGASRDSAGGPAHRVASAARDRWLAEDKLQHGTLAFAATAMGYAGARIALDADAALAVAGLAASVLAIGKELHDHRRGTGVSARDLAWDAAGMALGIALARRTR